MASAGLILIVDDDPAVSDLVGDILRERGYSVEIATGGAEALRRVRRVRPDAILLDIKLPDMSGAEVLPKLQALDPSLTVVMLSGTEDEALARSLLKAGAFDYVRKPFQVDALENAVSLAVAVGRGRPRAGGQRPTPTRRARG